MQTMNGAAHEIFICKSRAKLVETGKKCAADKCVQPIGVQPTRVDCISVDNNFYCVTRETSPKLSILTTTITLYNQLQARAAPDL